MNLYMDNNQVFFYIKIKQENNQRPIGKSSSACSGHPGVDYHSISYTYCGGDVLQHGHCQLL